MRDAQPSWQPQPQQAVYLKPKKRWPWLLAGLLVLIVVGCVALGALVAGTGSPDADLEPTGTPATHAQPVAPKSKAAATTIGEGDWIVGEDVPPGRYRTPGAEKGIITLCTWTVAPDEESDPQDFGTSGGTDEPGRVTLKDGNKFKTSGCKDWVKQ